MSELLATLQSESARTDVVPLVRGVVGSDLTIESIEVPREPRMGVLVLRGRLTVPSHVGFRRWLAELRPLGYTPLLRADPTGGHDAVALYILAGTPKISPTRPWLNILLFALTVLCTLVAGFLNNGNLDGITTLGDLLMPRYLLQGWPFSVTLLSILVAHEFGHYFAARYHKVAVTLPFFIPLPPIPSFLNIGTMGAFIRIKEPVSDRRKLFDIGVAGPLAGLVLAVPLLFIGLASSPVQVPPAGLSYLLEGNSIFYYLSKIMVFGRALPDLLTGEDVFINQVTFGAWIGLFVTALNLLPVSQLDGGHTVYALFGNTARYINWAALTIMGLLFIAGIPAVQVQFPALQAIGFLGWAIWLLLILFVFGPHHPPALDDVTELDSRRQMIGYLTIVIFILIFVPTPFRIV